MAPSKEIIQYVSSLIIPKRICGKNKIDRITSIKIVEAIIIVGIITINDYYPFINKRQ